MLYNMFDTFFTIFSHFLSRAEAVENNLHESRHIFNTSALNVTFDDMYYKHLLISAINYLQIIAFLRVLLELNIKTLYMLTLYMLFFS